MLTLGINCSGRYTNVGLAENGAVISEINEELGRKQTERLPLIAGELLSGHSSSIKDISVIAAGTGPGYYTGIRAGIAYSAGLAEALGIRVVPISSLELFAWDLKERYQEIAVFFKANLSHVYAAVYKSNGALLTPVMTQRFIGEADFADFLKERPCAVIVTPDLAKYKLLASLPNAVHERDSASGGTCALMGESFIERAVLPRMISGEYLRAPDIGPSLN